MENFFKQFRDNLERRLPPVFEEQDWQDMEKRLERNGNRRPALLAWQWLAWSLLLLSLGANALLYKELKAPSTPISPTDIRRDTVYKTRLIYRTDTIFRTRLVTAPLTAISQTHAISPAFSGNSDSMKTLSSVTSQAKQTNAATPTLSEDQRTRAATLPVFPVPLPTALNSQPPIPSLPEIPLPPNARKHRKTLEYHLYALRPKGFRLGIAGGWAYPFDKRLHQQGGYSAGLEANIEFSPQLQMWLGAAYYNVRFSASRMDAGIGIPDISPPTPDFTFVEAEAPQPSLEYSAGMQYFFNSRSPFKPFLGLGYGAVAKLPYEIVYEFENQSLGVEWSFDNYVNRNEFYTNLLLLRAGFEYKIWKKWHWQLRATYRSSFNKAGVHSPDQVGIQTGLVRRF